MCSHFVQRFGFRIATSSEKFPEWFTSFQADSATSICYHKKQSEVNTHFSLYILLLKYPVILLLNEVYSGVHNRGKCFRFKLNFKAFINEILNNIRTYLSHRSFPK